MKENEQKPLIAPVKEENSAMSYTEGMSDPGVDHYYEKAHGVPSEQEKQEEIWIDVSNVFTVAGHGDAAMKHLERTYYITRK